MKMSVDENNNTKEFELFAAAANVIRPEFFRDNSLWVGSPFEWILYLPSGSKGAIGKRLIYQWCALKGLSVDRSPDSEADMTINGHRVEIKFSTLWRDQTYVFQQLRDQNYEYCVCLGISPFEAHCWVLSKAILMEYVIGHMGQHTGAAGQETAWFSVDPKNPPEWLARYGGTLEQAYVVLRSLSPRK
jgi:hypothetical protein